MSYWPVKLADSPSAIPGDPPTLISLLRLPMKRMLTAAWAIFLHFHAPGVIAPVLFRSIVALLAILADQRDHRANIFLFRSHNVSLRSPFQWGRHSLTYSIILVMTPAPTVSPPSRMANFEPCSSATGMISSTVMFTSSPGITISTPSGSVIEPVTSIVRM